MSYAGYEYGTDAYGGGGGGWQGGGGGGFLAGGDGGMQSSQGYGGGSPSGKGSTRDKQTLLPVTIKQLLAVSQSEPDDHFRIDGVELHQIKLVGQIVDVEETSTTRTYKIDDGTGVFSVRMFIEADENDYQQERRAACQRGAYVRVVGQLREWQNNRSVSCHDMRPIKDPNEITHHMLEAIFAHCCNTKGIPSQKRRPGVGANVGQSAGMSFGGSSFGGMGQSGMDQGFDAVHMAVLSAFQADQSETGLHQDVVMRQLEAQGIGRPQVKEAISFLANQGHLYTTLDDSHFKTTA